MSELDLSGVELKRLLPIFNEFEADPKSIIAKLTVNNFGATVAEVDFCMAKLKAIIDFPFEAELSKEVFEVKLRFKMLYAKLQSLSAHMR